jgi:hypothetical protein
MCFPKIPKGSVAAPLIAAYDNTEAVQQGAIEGRLRRMRAGAAANVLTSPTGIPSVRQLGAVAA